LEKNGAKPRAADTNTPLILFKNLLSAKLKQLQSNSHSSFYHLVSKTIGLKYANKEKQQSTNKSVV